MDIRNLTEKNGTQDIYRTEKLVRIKSFIGKSIIETLERNMPDEMSLYENIIQQFNKAADRMDLDPNIRKILAKPMNEI